MFEVVKNCRATFSTFYVAAPADPSSPCLQTLLDTCRARHSSLRRRRGTSLCLNHDPHCNLSTRTSGCSAFLRLWLASRRRQVVSLRHPDSQGSSPKCDGLSTSLRSVVSEYTRRSLFFYLGLMLRPSSFRGQLKLHYATMRLWKASTQSSLAIFPSLFISPSSDISRYASIRATAPVC